MAPKAKKDIQIEIQSLILEEVSRIKNMFFKDKKANLSLDEIRKLEIIHKIDRLGKELPTSIEKVSKRLVISDEELSKEIRKTK